MSDEELEAAAAAPEGGAPAAEPGAEDAAPAGDAGDAGDAPAAGGEAEGGQDLAALKDVLEALVFVHRGILPPRTVREVLGEEFTVEQIEAGFAALVADYERRGGAIVLLQVAGGYQFGTRPELATWIQKLDFYEHHRHLSRPTLETLAIIAYKQPVTRAEIEAIRGVSVERIVRNLVERKLVRILGHKDVPGKPMVLGTTREFLELFGLNSLAGLPPLKDFIEPPSAEGIDEELPLAAPAADEAGEPPAPGGTTPGEPGDEGEEHEPGAAADEPPADAGAGEGAGDTESATPPERED